MYQIEVVALELVLREVVLITLLYVPNNQITFPYFLCFFYFSVGLTYTLRANDQFRLGCISENPIRQHYLVLQNKVLLKNWVIPKYYLTGKLLVYYDYLMKCLSSVINNV